MLSYQFEIFEEVRSSYIGRFRGSDRNGDGKIELDELSILQVTYTDVNEGGKTEKITLQNLNLFTLNLFSPNCPGELEMGFTNKDGGSSYLGVGAILPNGNDSVVLVGYTPDQQRAACAKLAASR